MDLVTGEIAGVSSGRSLLMVVDNMEKGFETPLRRTGYSAEVISGLAGLGLGKGVGHSY